MRGQRETKKPSPTSGGLSRRHIRGRESGHGGVVMVGAAMPKPAEQPEGGGERVSLIPRKLYVFLADRMAGTSPEYIMCFPPLGLGY